MSYHNWVRLQHKHFDSNKVALPKDIKKSKMDPEEMKEWTLDEPNYYDYFPLLKSINNGKIKVYYIDIRRNSYTYHFISKLIITRTGKQIIKLNIIPWSEVKYRMPVFYQKVTGVKFSLF